MKGNGCQFLHPKRCTKLMKYGTKSDKGCNLGKKCADFHPKMCISSIAKGVCYDTKCNLCHVKGTRRKRNQEVNESHKQQSKSSCGSEKTVTTPSNENPENNASATKEASVQESFLDQLSLLKKEVQEAMDLKISSIFSPMTFQPNHHKHNHALPTEGANQNQYWHVPPQHAMPVPMYHPQATQNFFRHQSHSGQ